VSDNHLKGTLMTKFVSRSLITWKGLHVMRQIPHNLFKPHPSNDDGIPQAWVPGPASQLQQVVVVTCDEHSSTHSRHGNHQAALKAS
jgi:hypothetical protein